MSAVNDTAMLTCAQCATEFAPGQRRGKVQIYCGPTCRVAGGNARRSTTRAGRILGITNPHASEPSGRPIAPEATNTPPSPSTPLSDSRSVASDRIAELMALAHSRGGINAWQVAELAKLKGRSPWAPLSKIIARKGHSPQ
jgi:hypothetical protein